MYLTKSIIQGLHILGFDKEVIKKVAREKSLEEIFLSTLFLNYIIVLVVFLLSLVNSPSIGGRELNKSVFFGLLMVYPFVFNLIVYAIYGFFGLFAELLNSKYRVKPLISVGFHTAIVYAFIVYVIGLASMFDPMYGLFMLGLFMLYFVLTMFLSLSTLYNFSTNQTLIVLMLPIFLIGVVGALLYLFIPGYIISLIAMLFA